MDNIQLKVINNLDGVIEFNIPDWMYAIAVILNESNANPDSIKANLYK